MDRISQRVIAEAVILAIRRKERWWITWTGASDHAVICTVSMNFLLSFYWLLYAWVPAKNA